MGVSSSTQTEDDSQNGSNEAQKTSNDSNITPQTKMEAMSQFYGRYFELRINSESNTAIASNSTKTDKKRDLNSFELNINDCHLTQLLSINSKYQTMLDFVRSQSDLSIEQPLDLPSKLLLLYCVLCLDSNSNNDNNNYSSPNDSNTAQTHISNNTTDDIDVKTDEKELENTNTNNSKYNQQSKLNPSQFNNAKIQAIVDQYSNLRSNRCQISKLSLVKCESFVTEYIKRQKLQIDFLSNQIAKLNRNLLKIPAEASNRSKIAETKHNIKQATQKLDRLQKDRLFATVNDLICYKQLLKTHFKLFCNAIYQNNSLRLVRLSGWNECELRMNNETLSILLESMSLRLQRIDEMIDHNIESLDLSGNCIIFDDNYEEIFLPIKLPSENQEQNESKSMESNTNTQNQNVNRLRQKTNKHSNNIGAKIMKLINSGSNEKDINDTISIEDSFASISEVCNQHLMNFFDYLTKLTNIKMLKITHDEWNVMASFVPNMNESSFIENLIDARYNINNINKFKQDSMETDEKNEARKSENVYTNQKQFKLADHDRYERYFECKEWKEEHLDDFGEKCFIIVNGLKSFLVNNKVITRMIVTLSENILLLENEKLYQKYQTKEKENENGAIFYYDYSRNYKIKNNFDLFCQALLKHHNFVLNDYCEQIINTLATPESSQAIENYDKTNETQKVEKSNENNNNSWNSNLLNGLFDVNIVKLILTYAVDYSYVRYENNLRFSMTVTSMQLSFVCLFCLLIPSTRF